jgi:hypothetical protein
VDAKPRTLEHAGSDRSRKRTLDRDVIQSLIRRRAQRAQHDAAIPTVAPIPNLKLGKIWRIEAKFT